MKKLIIIAAIVLAFTPLFARMNGRIGNQKVPYMITEIGMKWSEFTYNAPVHDYIAFDFGFGFDGKVHPGLVAGIDFQWLDAPKAAGVIRTNIFFLLDHQVTSMFFGGFLEASITAGPKISGFAAHLRGTVSWEPKMSTDLLLDLRVGAYVHPHDLVVISIMPGAGYSFLNDGYFYFTFSAGLQVYLWN
ncbi:hypothetical protein KAH37_07095 [bacterium]|nr:hypothetical protein [bacterium]